MDNFDFSNILLSNTNQELDHEILNNNKFKKFLLNINSSKKFDPRTISSYSEIELKNFIFLLDYSYHIFGQSLISDLMFQNFETYMNTNYNDVKLYLYEFLSNIILPVPMPSLSKLYINKKDMEIFQETIKQYNIVAISSKLDGVSCLITKNHHTNIYTKGNGKLGRNITHILKYINFDYSSLPKGIYRGELIINKKHSNQFESQKSLRAQVTGLINREPKYLKASTDLEKFKCIEILLYNIIKPKKFTFLQQLRVCKSNNFKTPYFEEFETSILTSDKLEQIYQKFIEKEEYEIDGLVVSNADQKYDLTTLLPKYASFAIKQNLIFTNAIVEDIIWSISRNKKYIPILKLKPIKLNHSIINKVTAHNAAFIFTNKIGIGSTICITSGGNVIPVIQNVIEKSDNIPFPSNAIWDENKTHLMSTQKYEPEVIAKQILKFYNIYNIRHFSFKTILNVIEKLASKGILIKGIFSFITGILTFLQNNPNDHILGVKRDKELIASIITFKEKKISLLLLLVTTNYFSLINELKLKSIFVAYPEIIQKIILNQIDDELKEKLLNIQGVGDIVSNNIIIGIKMFKNKQTLYDKYFNIDYTMVLEKEKKLNICFSQVKKADKFLEIYQDFINVQNSVTRTTDYLVLPNLKDFDETTKYNIATKFNVPIISVPIFIQLMNTKINERV